MDLELAGKTVAITGAASGIGRATALAAAAEGARVALIDRNDAASVAADIGPDGTNAQAYRCDLLETDAIDRVFAQIDADFGGLDLQVNCAGTMGDWPKPATEASDEDWSLTIDTNLKGTFACCRAALPLLRRTGGTIVNVASELGLISTAGLVIYGAAKAGILNLTRGLAIEEIEHGVRVNCVCPGPVDSPFLQTSRRDGVDSVRRKSWSTTLMGRLGTPEEIADVILFVGSARASFMTGSIIVADGGVTAHD